MKLSRKKNKVVVVLQLPSDRKLTKYCIRETNEMLEVEIHKHLLMLNPEALLFSGIKSGVLNNDTDGPHTTCGGTRLNVCSKALSQHRMTKKMKSNNKNDRNSMSLTFNIPDYITHDGMIYYNYCFQKTPFSNLCWK